VLSYAHHSNADKKQRHLLIFKCCSPAVVFATDVFSDFLIGSIAANQAAML
jgi:hypothetical protein